VWQKTYTNGERREGVKLPPGISPLLDKIETKFQWQSSHFRGQTFQEFVIIVGSNWKSENKDGGHQTGST
jgi:hypothetical protein